MTPSQPKIADSREVEVPDSLRGERLDRALVALLPEYSRSRLQAWIEQGRVLVNGKTLRSRDKLSGGERVIVSIEAEVLGEVAPQALPLNIVYEDESLIVVHKPPGLVVHPGAGNPDGTLQNALLHHAPELAGVPRAGLVHRIDKDTGGLLVVARNLASHASLVAAMQAREIERTYEAVVCGVLTAGGTVDEPIGRDARDRTRMRVSGGARNAVTHYRVLKRFRAHTHVQLKLETGRTHQIRVHMQHLRHPLVGDPVYGRRLAVPARATPRLAAALHAFRRQALHACKLALTHPRTHEGMQWESPLPADMAELLAALQEDSRENAGP